MKNEYGGRVATILWSPGLTCHYHQEGAQEGRVIEPQFVQLRSPDRRPAGAEGRQGESLGCLLAHGWQPDQQPAMMQWSKCKKKAKSIHHLGNQLPSFGMLVTDLLPALWKYLQNAGIYFSMSIRT